MKRTGFTLIELLVVIFITALLLAILVPSLRSTREQAKTILCKSNIKQLALGLAMYENENGTFPHALDETRLELPPGESPGNPMYDKMGWWWFNHIVDYSIKDSDKSSIIWCPSRQIKGNEFEGNVLCGNYGVNRSICKTLLGMPDRHDFTGKPLRITEISRPGETLLVVDSGYSMITWLHATDKPNDPLNSISQEDTAYIPGLKINKDRNLRSDQEHDALNGRHPNKTVNVGFADGHIDRVKAEELFVEKTADNYRNKSPLWVPK